VTGGGTINGSGLFTAGATPGGPHTVTATSGAISGTASVTVAAATQTIIFDDKTGQDQPLNGQYPTNVANWGTGVWYHSGPFGLFGTKSASFLSGAQTSGAFTFITARQLISLQAYNGGPGSSTVTVACAGQPTRSQSVAVGVVVTITTNWTGTCTTVTLTSSNGWNVNFDNIVHASGGPPQNQAPSVNAGTDASVTLPASAALDATVSDDGLPSGGTLTTTWTEFSGPGDVTFGNANAVDTTASFTLPGTYTLRLTANDSALSAADDVVITVLAPNNPPTVATAASASPNPVNASTSSLSVLGADDGGEAALTYTWSMASGPLAPTFSANGTNAAKNTTATFSRAGAYVLRATIRDAGNQTVTSDVSVTVNQTLTSIVVTPSPATVVVSTTQQFAATARDQFAQPMSPQPVFTWSVSGGGTINGSGLFTAGATPGGPHTVTATSGAISGTASVTVAAATQTIIFDDKTGQNQPLNGQYPTNVVNWGTGVWYHSGPFGLFGTKSASFLSGAQTSGTFTFINPQVLISLQAYNGGPGSSTVTVACAGQPTRSQSVAAGVVVTITTNWTGTCTTVTLTSSNGWDTNFDNIVYGAAGGALIPASAGPTLVLSAPEHAPLDGLAIDAMPSAAGPTGVASDSRSPSLRARPSQSRWAVRL
jgi:hypothetical protein